MVAYFDQVNYIGQGNFAPGLIIIVAVAALLILVARQDTTPVGVDSSPSSEKVILVLILVAGAAMRLWNLASTPEGVWFDEAQNGLVANQILTVASYKPVYIGELTQLPALFSIIWQPSSRWPDRTSWPSGWLRHRSAF